MNFYKNIEPEQLAAVSMVLEGSALHALIRQCASDFNAPALRAMYDAGRFAIEARDLFSYAGRDVDEVPSSTRSCLSVIDALSALTKKTSFENDAAFVNGSDWERGDQGGTYLRLPADLRSVLRDIYGSVALQLDELVDSKQQQMGQLRADTQRRYAAVAAYAIEEPADPEDDHFDPYEVDLEIRDHTFAAMLSVACASNDVALVEQLLATRTGADWLARPAQFPSTRCDDKADFKGNAAESLQLKPAGWALLCNAHDVLDQLTSKGISIVQEAAHLVFPGRGEEGSDSYAALSAWKMFDMLSTAPSIQTGRQLFAAMRRSDDALPYSRREADFIIERCCSSNEWPHLIASAVEFGIFKASPEKSLELGLLRKIPAVIAEVVESATFPEPELFEGYSVFPSVHPVSLVLGAADKEHWKSTSPSDQVRDLCLNLVLKEMERRDLIATALTFTRVSASSKDVLDACMSGRYPMSMGMLAHAYANVSSDDPAIGDIDAKMRSCANASAGTDRCALLQAAIARRSAIHAIESMHEPSIAGAHP